MARYRLHKSKAILFHSFRAFQRRKGRLAPAIAKEFKELALELQDAILTHDRKKADQLARHMQQWSRQNLYRSQFEKFFELAAGLIGALAIAVVIRQTTFEPYEIPSGSMRPTYKEQDRLVVSKTQFGLNIPLTTKHLFFHPEEIKRMGVIVFTGEGMDIHNVKTRYFYLFPGYRQFIKRMIGLPGDTLYFYGGKIYGIDKNGNDITPLLQPKELSSLEHIPFIQLEGKAVAPREPVDEVYSPIVFRQANIPLAKLYLTSKRTVDTDFLLNPATEDHTLLKKFDIYQLWGMENFATARILPKSVLPGKDRLEMPLQASNYYLELTHHQSAAHPTINRDAYFRIRPSMTVERSYIPLKSNDLEKIWQHIYTGRFIVQNGYIHRYGMSSEEVAKHSFLPKLKGEIPDGTYEFTDGQLYQVKSQGLLEKCSLDHPLAQFSPRRLFILFNAGIECDIRFLPVYHDQTVLPSRYAYFRNGELFLMGAKIFDKDSDTLQHYIAKEKFKQERTPDYVPFIDRGPPLKEDGALDKNFIQMYGLHVPEHHYFVLGDNHAMSGDSRDFGFVPESNLRGIPSFLFWAPGGRFGFPNGTIYPFFTWPKLLIWSTLMLLYCAFTFLRIRFYALPLKFPQEDRD